MERVPELHRRRLAGRQGEVSASSSLTSGSARAARGDLHPSAGEGSTGIADAGSIPAVSTLDRTRAREAGSRGSSPPACSLRRSIRSTISPSSGASGCSRVRCRRTLTAAARCASVFALMGDRYSGNSVRAAQWLGRTTAKCRRSRVATFVSPSRSQATITAASTSPRSRDSYECSISAARTRPSSSR